MSPTIPDPANRRSSAHRKSPSRGRGERPGTPHHASAQAANTFAALGDRTRLALISRLSRGGPWSISQLTHGSHLTRQAITKHLRVLEHAKIVRCVRSGRHSLFQLDPEPVHQLRDYLDRISVEWDNALARLKSFVED